MTRTIIGVMVFLLGTIPATAQTKPEDVVKKAIEAHGGLSVLKKFNAGVSKIGGKMFVGQESYTFTGLQMFSIPGRVRMEITLETLGKKLTLVQIVNGDQVYQIENGVTGKIDEPFKAELRESAVSQELSLLYPLLDTTKYTLVAEKDVPVGGQNAAVIVVQSKGLKDTRLFFDRATGRLVAMQRRSLNPSQKAVDEVTIFSDYKAIDGLVVPMKSKVSHDGKPYMEIIVDSYKPLEKIDEKPFLIK